MTYIRNYSVSLSKPQWQKKRLERFNAAGWKCEQCGSEKRYLHLHHPEYGDKWKEPWDYDNLQVLCSKCHKDQHAFDEPDMIPGGCYTVREGAFRGCTGILEDYHTLHFWDDKREEWQLRSWYGTTHHLRKASSREEVRCLRMRMEAFD